MSMSFYYPGGKQKALTMSYDDSVTENRRLVEIFNASGIRGSFHLNSGRLDRENTLSSTEIKSLFAGHEISCHSLEHPYPERIPQTEWLRQIWEDRKNLEALAGYPVVGMSYPYNVSHESVVRAAQAAGIVCARNGLVTGRFGIPENFLCWTPSCHHTQAMQLLPGFRSLKYRLGLFFVWGHAYEFERSSGDCDWRYIEKFCREAGGDPNVWYATNLEICRYLTAIQSAVTGCDGHLIYNPSAETLYLSSESGRDYVVAPGETLELL